ncbi:MAG: hypothetical protein ACR2PH_06440, partial [Desulfobulbia bacterium]
SDNDYAHGLVLGSYRNMPTITHAGSWLGNNSYQQYLPEQQLTILVASNNLLINPVDVSNRLTDAILNLSEVAEASTSGDIDIPESRLEAFVGLYETGLGDFKKFTIREGQLGLQALPNRQFHPMVAVGPSRFRFPDETGEQVEFLLDDAGETTHYLVHIDNNPPLTRKRVAWAETDEDILAEYEGRYFSEELETLYTIRLKDRALVASSVAFGDIKLNPASEDNFTGVFWFPTVRFLRDDMDAISGFNVTADRIRNVRFSKIDW